MPIRLFYLLLLCPLLAFSQISQYKIYNISNENGLLSNSVECIYQDTYGFLWTGSFDGLVRWDGNSFRKYVHDDNDPLSLSQNIINCIFEDSQRRLWIGSLGGLDLYNRETDSFEKIILLPGVDRVPLNAITEDKAGNLWLGTSSGLCCYNPSSNKTKWHFESEKKDSLSDNVIFSIAKDQANNLWLGTFNKGVVKYSFSTGKFIRIQHVDNDLKTICSNKIKKMLVDKEGNIWAGSFDKGITKLSDNGVVLNHYTTRAPSEATEDYVSCLYQDKNNIIWIGKGNELLHYLDIEKNKLIPFTNPVYKKYHMQCTGIAAMSEDNFGNTWFGSHSNGLFYTNVDKNKFHHFTYNYINPKELKNNIVTCFYQQNKSAVWVGTEKGLHLFNPTNNTFKYFTIADGLSSEHIQAIQEDNTGMLWIASWSGGLMQLNPKTNKIKTFTHQAQNDNSIIYNNLKSIVLQDSLIWIGTHGEGLCTYNLKTKKFIHHKNNSTYPFNMLEPSWINHLFLDSKKRLWIGSYGGLYMFDQKKFHAYKKTSDKNSLRNNDINMIAEDGAGRIWIATEAGSLELYQPKTNNFKHYNAIGLPPTIKALQSDNSGALWLSGNDGLYCLHTETNSIEHYDISDGLQENSFFLKSILKDSKGNIYAGGSNGFNIFHPSEIEKKLRSSTFYFTDLFIFDKIQKPSTENSPLEKQLAFSNAVNLSYEQSFFTIHFTLVDFYSSASTHFAYKLIGLHDEWINLGNERKVSFTEIPSGEYTLKIKYTIGDGIWKEADQKLIIIVNPPWWNSIWFKIGILLSIILSLLLLYKIRVSNIKNKNKALEKEVSIRTLELSERNNDLIESNEEIKQQKEKLELYNEEVVRQSDKILAQQEYILSQNKALEKVVEKLSISDETKNLFFTILAHDLKGPINAIGSLSELLINNISTLSESEILEFSQHIQKSASSTKELLYNLLDWARTQSHYLDYKPVDLNVSDLFIRNIMLLEQQFIQKNISINNSIDQQHCIVADNNMIDTIIRNLLSNAVKYTPENGTIAIDAIAKENEIELKIQDTGIGMTEEEINNLFKLEVRTSKKGTKGENGTGLGLIIVKEFIEINKGSISVESNPKNGTTFIISLPLSNSFLPAIYDKHSILNSPKNTIEQLEFTEEELSEVKGNKILIVEDNPIMRNHLKFLLSSIFEITEAENGQEALSIAATLQPLVIITDMTMPIMGGLEFCRTLKKDNNTSHIPVIILTSNDTDESQLSGYYAGADIYLTKPAKKALLFQVIQNILKSRENFRQKLLALNEGNIEDNTLNILDNELLDSITNYIEQHIGNQNLDVNQLVRHLGMSRSVLYSKFKAITGQGVNEYIRLVRLRKSKQLLIKNQLSINEISDAVGFNSASYFIRCFVNEYKSTPGEFKESLSNKHSIPYKSI